MNEQEQAIVVAALGDGRIICGQCGATLDTYDDVCSAQLYVRCPGFNAIENVLQPPAGGGGG